jgi:hypothetical protein
MKKENQLLSRLVKMVTGEPAKPQATAPEVVVEVIADAVEAPVEAVAAVAEKVIETLELRVDTTEMQAVIADLQAQVDAVKAEFGVKLDASVAALAEMTGKFEGAQAALVALAAEKEAMVAAAAATKLNARKAKIEAAIGTEKAAGLMAATEGLEDAQFDAVISALVGSVNAEANTSLFKEVGVTAEADATKIVTESAEMRILKQQFGAK